MSFASLLGSSHLIHLYFTTSGLDKEVLHFAVLQAIQNSGHI